MKLQSARTRHIVWLVWVLALTLLLLVVATRNLANYPLAGGDEVWNMSVAHKLATRGVFGSDLFAGFFGADRHYFLALPLHHFWLAAMFKVWGTGVAQARWVSLLAGVVLLWVASGLAYRWFGLATSLLTGLLLVFWRSDLLGLEPGLPLLAVARSGRHDIGTIAWYWLAVACLYLLLLRPRRGVALAVGMCSGAAALTHFYGAFVIPVVAVAWLWHRGRRALADPVTYWILFGLGLVLGPYAGYVALHWSDFQGQMLIHQSRTTFADLSFYLENLLGEPRRLAHMAHLPALRWPGYEPLGPWLFWIGIGPALIYLLARARSPEATGPRLLALSLVVPWGLLALVEQVKAPLYMVVLLPGVCMALAACGVGLVRRMLEICRGRWARLAIAALVAGCVGLVVLEGAATHALQWQRAAQVRGYLDVGREIEARLVPGATVAGLERWWWALHEHPYRSLDSLWLQWQAAVQPGEPQPRFSHIVADNAVSYILVNPQVAVYIQRYPRALQAQFWAFLEERCVPVADWADPSYGPIVIYRVE